MWQNHSGPLTSSTFPLWTVTVWTMLQSSEHQNDQTQEQSLPSGNPSHEHLTMIMVHTLFIYLTHILSLHFKLHIIYLQYVHTKQSIAIYLYIQLSICILLFLIYLFFFILIFIICVFCSVTVILLHWGIFCHENKFLVGVNIPGNKAHSDSDYDMIIVQVQTGCAM